MAVYVLETLDVVNCQLAAAPICVAAEALHLHKRRAGGRFL